MNNDEINQKIQKLLNLSSNNPSEEEAKAALLKAQELMLKYHIDQPESVDDGKVAAISYNLGSRRKTEFVLMIAVLAANNFRSKTAHRGKEIFFFGFEEDARAAVSAFEYALKFGDSTHDRYFKNHPINKETDQNWRYGYIVGLHKAFSSRKGYELMECVPRKVLDFYKTLNPTHEIKYTESDNPTRTDGAFTDGYRRGHESLGKREIEKRSDQ